MLMDVKDPVPAPTEVLIPEARDHQKRRYLWTALVATLAALVLAALIGGAVIVFSRSPTGSGARHPAAPAALASSSSFVYFRPVLCVAPAYAPAAGAVPSATTPSCSPSSLLDASNLDVTPGSAKTDPDGFMTNNVPPDGALATVPSTSRAADLPSATVLLSTTRGAAGYEGPRVVLGPAQMTSASISTASVHKDQFGQWIVDYNTSASGAARWDAVAEKNFHQELGIDLDGRVVSAPLIQPTQSSFSSFDGRGEVSGSLTRSEAVALARALTSRG
jgi:preprotein translocase subunit SecD